MPEKNKLAWPPPEGRTCYLVYEDGGAKYLVRYDGKDTRYLIRANKYSDLLETVIQDARLHVYKATARHLLEVKGEAHWRYSNKAGEYEYEFAPPPEFLLKPDDEEEEEKEIIVAGWKWVGEGDPKPMPPEFGVLATVAEMAKNLPPGGNQAESFCPIHKVEKKKDGKIPKGPLKGKQKYICPDCRLGKPPRVDAEIVPADAPQTHYVNPPCRTCKRPLKIKATNVNKAKTVKTVYFRCENDCEDIGPKSERRQMRPPTRTPGKLKHGGRRSLKDNPVCKTCHAHLYVSDRVKDKRGNVIKTYYYCKNDCPDTGQNVRRRKRTLLDNPEELEKYVRAKVTAANGHHPQDRDDIVQEILQDLLVTKKLKLEDLEDRERIRAYIRSQTRHSQDKFERPSLDAPVRSDEAAGQTFADTKPAPEADSDPHQQLEAKEAVEARLRDGVQTDAEAEEEKPND